MLVIQRPSVEAIGSPEGNRQKFSVGPLEPGLGHTIGNSLRRMLLSSIPGAAITSVKFESALHEFDVIEGPQANEQDWAFFYRCYQDTYHAHGQRPYLNEALWQTVGQRLAPHWVMFVARQGGERIACSLLAVDRAQGVAYGRYWGALQAVSCLHFEACYYQPLAWCINQGLSRFEGGAQGEHKLARGLLPVTTNSVHWLAHPGLRHAVSDFLMREDLGLTHYVNELDERKPFKPQD